jgi:hypothetical protein
MTSITNRLYKLILPRLFARLSPNRIPRSGEAGEKMNCFSVFVEDQNGKNFFAAKSFEGTTLKGKRLEADSSIVDAEIDLTNIGTATLKVVHYYGLDEMTYRGILGIAFTWAFPLTYLHIHFRRLKDKMAQSVYNRRSLQSIQRLRVLRFMVDWHIENSHALTSIDVMTQMHSIRWVLHPHRDAEQKRMELFLESLADSGELTRKDGYRYIATGRALTTIEQSEEEERRHTENSRIQWAMVMLSFVIALLTVVQAGLVKLPTFFVWP